METQLFSDKEIFTKVRPVKLTEQLENEFWQEKAKYVYKMNWVGEIEEIKDIITDLSELSMSDSGYEMAKDLENRGRCDWDIDSELISFLEGLYSDMNYEYKKLVKKWVSIHNPQPLWEIGTKLIIGVSLNSKMKVGTTIWITGMNRDTAEYLYWDEEKHNGGYVATYERIEGSCKSID